MKKRRRNFEISTLLRQEGNGRRKGNREKSSPAFFAPWKKYVSYSLLRRENLGVGLISGCSSIVHLARSWVAFFPRRWRQSLPDRGGQAQAVGFSLCVCARPNGGLILLNEILMLPPLPHSPFERGRPEHSQRAVTAAEAEAEALGSSPLLLPLRGASSRRQRLLCKLFLSKPAAAAAGVRPSDHSSFVVLIRAAQSSLRSLSYWHESPPLATKNEPNERPPFPAFSPLFSFFSFGNKSEGVGGNKKHAE